MRIAVVIALCLLAACGRPLTPDERAFLGAIHGPSLDADRLRVVNGAPVVSVTVRRALRPRLTCRERILPAPTTEVFRAKPAAIALFNRIFLTRDWYEPNYMPRYPDRLHLVEAMLLAHEATHVWQWQNRALTGYHPLRAAAEHGISDDPYLFELNGKQSFLDYGFEQQGAIVEEYVCCRALAPQAARTARLHDLLRQSLPVSPLPQTREHNVILPWKDAKLGGICG